MAGGARFRGRSEPATWLYSIALRRLADYHRRGSAERRTLDRLKLERPPADPDLLADIERGASLHTLRAELTAALSQLAPGVRDAVQMRVVQELSYAEIASRRGS